MERRFFVFGKGLVRGQKLRQEHAVKRHPVENDVMQRQKEAVFCIAQPDEPKSIHWTPREIERLACIVGCEAKRFLFGSRVRAQIDERNFDMLWGWMD